MSNKIPLDPNGVQPGYKVRHILKNDCLGENFRYAEILRSKSGNMHFYYWDNIEDVGGSKTIAVFKLKRNLTPLSVRLAQHAARGRFIHIINKPYA